MTREEQIIAEAKKHYYDDINCHNAFMHGVEWADKHPANVWHDASEEPEDDRAQLMYQDRCGECWNLSRHERFVCKWGWQRIVLAYNIRRWAYISDLLPKGGEE